MLIAPVLMAALPLPVSAMGAAPDRILFVGQVFDRHPGIVRHVGNLTAAAFRFDTPAIGVPFSSGGAAKGDRLEAALRSVSPVVVVISAVEAPAGRPGDRRALRQNLLSAVDAAVRSGARVLLLSHPPAKPRRPVGFTASVGQIEAVTASVAAETGATLVRTGAFFAGFPAEDRLLFYRQRGDGFSVDGQRAIALTIAIALGIDLRAMAYQGADEPPPSDWIERGADWAVSTGLRQPPLLP